MSTLRLSFATRATRPRAPHADLLAELEGLSWPRHVRRRLPSIVRDSWKAYVILWASVQSHYTTETPNGRLLAKILASGFLQTPHWFLRRWFAKTIFEEAQWKKADPKRWAVWSLRNEIFLEAGEKLAEDYCGDRTRFAALLKELMR